MNKFIIQFSNIVFILLALSSNAQNLPYCNPQMSPVGANAATEPISLVQFGTGGGAINNSTIATISNDVPKYEDFTATAMIVQRGNTYPLTVKGNTDGNNTCYITVYVDWNADGIFSNSLSANEKYQQIPALVNSTGTDEVAVNYTITIPSDAVIGNTRMRIVKNYQAPSPNPCYPVATFGQTEDYTLTITDSNPVYSVVVTTENNITPVIVTGNGSLQLQAAVLPATASQGVTWSIISGQGIVTVSQNGLVTAGSSNGYALVRAISQEDPSKYSDIEIAIALPQVPAIITYTENFESDDKWAYVSQPDRNTKWVRGTATQNGGSKSLYVSADYGATNSTDTQIVSVVHTYRDIILPAGVGNLSIAFDWKAIGDYSNTGWGYQAYNYMQAWIVPQSYTPVGGSLITQQDGFIKLQGNHQDDNFLGQPSFTSFSNQNLNVSAYAGQTVRLVFTWRTLNGTSGIPAAIDNLVVSLSQPAVSSVTVSTLNNIPATITTVNGSLQLVSQVLPASANQGVAWTVLSGSQYASVNSNGLVTAQANGTVTVRATSVVNPIIYNDFQVTVNSTQQNYCDAYFINGCSDYVYISSLNTTGGTANINNLSSGCSDTGSLTGYANFTQHAVSAPRGSTVNFITGFTTTSLGTAYLSVWIDWNQDFEFSDNEQVYVSNENQSEPASVTFSVPVPANAVLGSTRIRIKAVNGWLGSGACGYNSFGEVEDYTFTVLENIQQQVNITTVNDIPSEITQNNGTLQLLATTTPAGMPVTWIITEGIDLATIDNNGLVTATANGTIKVKATINGTNIYDEITVVITNQVIAPTGIVVTVQDNAQPVITTVNGTLQLTATVLPENAQNIGIIWSVVQGTGLAEVSSAGLVTAIENGVVTVRAALAGSNTIYGDLQVTVNVPAVNPCTAQEEFMYDFNDFTAFPQQCWATSQIAMLAMAGLTGTEDKAVQLYSFTFNEAIYIVSPELTSIDGQHVLAYDITGGSSGSTIEIGTMPNQTEFAAFIPAGGAENVEAGSYETDIITAPENHRYIALKFIPNGLHKSVNLNNIQWKAKSLHTGNNAKTSYNVYPNPAKDIVNVQSVNVVKFIEVYNSLGQYIGYGTTNQIDISDYAAGVYILHITFDSNNTVIQKIIKK